MSLSCGPSHYSQVERRSHQAGFGCRAGTGLIWAKAPVSTQAVELDAETKIFLLRLDSSIQVVRPGEHIFLDILVGSEG
jgi:hypothetical protein